MEKPPTTWIHMHDKNKIEKKAFDGADHYHTYYLLNVTINYARMIHKYEEDDDEELICFLFFVFV